MPDIAEEHEFDLLTDEYYLGEDEMPKQVRRKSAPRQAGGYLDQITTAVKPRAMSTVLYGPPGVGKTSLGANFPGALFLIDSQEQGVHDLKAARLLDANIPVLPEVTEWEQILTICRQLAESVHDYKTLVVDSLTGMERLCFNHVCEEEFNGDWSTKGFYSYHAGFDISAKRYWPTFLDHLDLVRQSGMNVILIAHSDIRRHDDPERESYDRYEPNLHRKIWGCTHQWAEAVFFLNFHVDLEGKGSKKRATGGHDRFLHTEGSGPFIAKNRLGLPAIIEMGISGQEAFDNLNEQLPNPLVR